MGFPCDCGFDNEFEEITQGSVKDSDETRCMACGKPLGFTWERIKEVVEAVRRLREWFDKRKALDDFEPNYEVPF